MLCSKLMPGFAAACLILLCSCKKDLVSPLQLTDAAVVSDNANVNDVHETAAPVATARTTYVSSNCAGYYEVLPARYRITTKKYPLLIFIHGIGELGTGVNRLACCGLPYYASRKLFPPEFVVNGQRFSYVVVAPQFKMRPAAWQVQQIIDYAKKKYRIDPTRVYVAGMSMGGGSAWDYAAVYGRNIAATVPVCGGTAPNTWLAASVAASGVPVWTISSTADALVPISWARNWVAWIKTKNPANAANVKLTELRKGESHNVSWAKATNPATSIGGYNIYQWMLRYQRVNGRIVSGPAAPVPAPVSGTNKPPVAIAGSNSTIHLFWKFNPLLNATLSKDPDGWITSVVWTKVSGPNNFYLIAPRSLKTRARFWVVGNYVFRVTIKDNRGAVSTDLVTVKVLP